MSLVVTTRKLGISFFEYVGERICKSGIISSSVQKEAAIAASFRTFKKYLDKQ
ncbi:hypothetical protein [Nostoc sp.]|uniref:hypothetical protein n=1 Tax=Nostoc sp. TaxID=1180 RepID=UPI002FFB522B